MLYSNYYRKQGCNRKRKRHGESEDPKMEFQLCSKLTSYKSLNKSLSLELYFCISQRKVSKSQYSTSLNLYFPKESCQHLDNRWKSASTTVDKDEKKSRCITGPEMSDYRTTRRLFDSICSPYVTHFTHFTTKVY